MQNQKSNVQIDVRERAYKYSIRIINFLDLLPGNMTGGVIAKQLMRSATSIGANLVESKGASSKKEFGQFFTYSLRSANETLYWLGLLRDAKKMESAEFAIPLKKMPKDQNKLFVKVLKQTMPSLLRSQTRLVAKVLQKDIWKARILEVYNNPGKVKIGAGKDVGIKEGMLLKVFDWGKKINSPYASSFHCFGKKIGLTPLLVPRIGKRSGVLR